MQRSRFEIICTIINHRFRLIITTSTLNFIFHFFEVCHDKMLKNLVIIKMCMFDMIIILTEPSGSQLAYLCFINA